VLFLAGFSYVEKPEGYVHNEEGMATELYSALTQFFAKYNQYSRNAFYVFGESYAGKYVPAISYKIMREGFKINLKGFGYVLKTKIVFLISTIANMFFFQYW